MTRHISGTSVRRIVLYSLFLHFLLYHDDSNRMSLLWQQWIILTPYTQSWRYSYFARSLDDLSFHLTTRNLHKINSLRANTKRPPSDTSFQNARPLIDFGTQHIDLDTGSNTYFTLCPLFGGWWVCQRPNFGRLSRFELKIDVQSEPLPHSLIYTFNEREDISTVELPLRIQIIRQTFWCTRDIFFLSRIPKIVHIRSKGS
jgi:hypothetical protein